MKFIEIQPYTFLRGDKKFTSKQVLDLIKDGNDVNIVDEHDNDQTKQFMIKHAFRSRFRNFELDFLATMIDEELLTDILSAGDLENWLRRQA